MLVDVFVESYPKPPRGIWLDLDATDDPLHGQQEGRFFHGYYKCYCYLPLYIFCGDHLLCARLRPSNIDGAAGSVDELTRIVAQIRESWPTTRIVIRGDSGFCRDAIMSWCEDNDVDYVLGLARNARLVRVLGETMQDAQRAHEHTGQAARRFLDFTCQTRKSWSRRRRVVGKGRVSVERTEPPVCGDQLSTRRAGARRLYVATLVALTIAANAVAAVRRAVGRRLLEKPPSVAGNVQRDGRVTPVPSSRAAHQPSVSSGNDGFTNVRSTMTSLTQTRVCGCCGDVMTRIGEKTSEQVDVIPMQVYVNVHHRPTCSCSHDLPAKLLQVSDRHLSERGLLISEGTIVDATIVAASPSTKNQARSRDPEMKQTKKGNQWYFGMKAHVGTDPNGLVHTTI